MPSPATYNVDIYKGDDYELVVYIKDGNGVAINITGWTGRAQIRDGAGSLRVAFTVDTTASPTTGKVTVSLTDTQTTALAVSTDGLWDLELTASGKTRTYLKGTVTVTADVTKD